MEENKFEVGKWYKGYSSFIKFLTLENKGDYNKVFYSESISGNEFNSNKGYWANIVMEQEALKRGPIPLEEIQQYLPEGHPDKIKIHESHQQFKLNNFPIEGSCDTINEKIREYLDNICSVRGDSNVSREQAKGIAWNLNSKDWWYYKQSSAKLKYTKGELMNIIGVREKEMNKEELIAEAKRRFGNLPIGTEIKGSRWSGIIKITDYKIEIKHNTIWIMSKYTDKFSIDLYQNNKWAEIISESKEKETKYKIGDEIYVHTIPEGRHWLKETSERVFILKSSPAKYDGGVMWKVKLGGIPENCFRLNTLKQKENYDLSTVITRAVKANDPGIISKETGKTIEELCDRMIGSGDSGGCKRGDWDIWLNLCSGLSCGECIFNKGLDKAKAWLRSKENRQTLEDFYNCKIWLEEETTLEFKNNVVQKLKKSGGTGLIQISNIKGLALFIDSGGKIEYSNSYAYYVTYKAKAITIEDLGMELEKRYIAGCDIATGKDKMSVSNFEDYRYLLDMQMTPLMNPIGYPTSFQGFNRQIKEKPSLDKDGILSALISKKKKRKVKVEIFSNPKIVELNIKKRRK